MHTGTIRVKSPAVARGVGGRRDKIARIHLAFKDTLRYFHAFVTIFVNRKHSEEVVPSLFYQQKKKFSTNTLVFRVKDSSSVCERRINKYLITISLLTLDIFCIANILYKSV